MTNGRNKYQARENRARVREILLRDWDPIGVAGVPDAADEYDSYVGAVYVSLVDQRASKDGIFDYLFSAATDHMGLSSSEWLVERCNRTAEILIQLRPSFETH